MSSKEREKAEVLARLSEAERVAALEREQKHRLK